MKKKIIDRDYDYENCCLKNNLGIISKKELQKAESDFAIVRLNELIRENKEFIPSVEYLCFLHQYIFRDVYPFAGRFRNIHIEKEERILGRLSVAYAEPEDIEASLANIFNTIRSIDFDKLKTEEQIDFISKMITEIWKTHPFREGNTRTTLCFLRFFLKSHDITFSNSLFRNIGNFEYIRNALVAASFEDKLLGIERNYSYIKRVISDIIYDNLEERKKL